jgi:hypothetical protein
MDSTPEDRLAVILKLYETARDQQDADIAQATSDEECDAIQNNLDQLKQDYMRAERQRLEASGAAVEAAYRSAQAAADDVAKAYRQGKALADRIRSVSAAVSAASSLVAKASALA